jgi:hypothetical protein
MTRRELQRRERRVIWIESFVSGVAFSLTAACIIVWMLSL